MSNYYYYLAVCPVVGGICFVVQKCFEAYSGPGTAAVTRPEIKAENTKNVARTKADEKKELVKAVRMVRAYSKTRKETFQNKFNEAGAMLCEITAKCSSVTAVAGKPTQKLNRAKDSREHNMKHNTETKVRQRRSSINKNRSTSPIVPSEAKSFQTKVSLVGRAKKTKRNRSSDQIENCQPKDSLQRKDKRMISLDRLAPPKTRAEIAIERKKSARMCSPYLFKRLTLTKKSAMELSDNQANPILGGRKSKQVRQKDLAESKTARKNVALEPNLRNQELACKEIPAKTLPEEKSADLAHQCPNKELVEAENSDVSGMESDEAVEFTVQIAARSRKEKFSTLTREENSEIHFADIFARSISPSSIISTTARNSSPSEVRGRRPLPRKLKENPSKVKPSHTEREQIHSRSSSYHKRKSYDAKCRMKVSSANLSRCLSEDVPPTAVTVGKKKSLIDLIEKVQDCEGEHHKKDNSNQDILNLGQEADLSSNVNSLRKRRNHVEKPKMEGSCSNQGRSKSPDTRDEATKTKPLEKKIENQAETHTKDVKSNLGRLKAAQKDSVFEPFDKRKELQSRKDTKNMIPKLDRPKSAVNEGSSPLAKRMAYQAKYRMKSPTLNYARS